MYNKHLTVNVVTWRRTWSIFTWSKENIKHLQRERFLNLIIYTYLLCHFIWRKVCPCADIFSNFSHATFTMTLLLLKCIVINRRNPLKWVISPWRSLSSTHIQWNSYKHLTWSKNNLGWRNNIFMRRQEGVKSVNIKAIYSYDRGLSWITRRCEGKTIFNKKKIFPKTLLSSLILLLLLFYDSVFPFIKWS